jgi:signal transduction histidine kinase
VLSLAEAALTEMRALILALRPEALEEEGLVVALRQEAEAVRTRHRLDIETELAVEPTIAIAAKEAIYRIAHEALHNVVKHAQARRVRIRLELVHGGFLFEVQDDGVGFDPDAGFSGHLGLRSMRERVERCGGELRVDSAAGRTIVRAVLPATEDVPPSGLRGSR